jgi:hypothetical protein
MDRSITRLLLTLALACGAAPAWAQGAPATDPLRVRFNGTQKLTQVLLPMTAQTSGQTRQEVDEVPILTEEHHTVYLSLPGGGLVGYGVVVSTWLSDLELDVPVAADSVTAKFMPPPSGMNGRLLTWFDFDDARMRFRLNVRLRPQASGIPKEVLGRLSFDRSFAIDIRRFTGSVDFRLDRKGTGLTIAEGSQYMLQLGSVAIDNPGLLQQTADFVLGFDRLFKVVGASSSNEAVTKITNNLLMQRFDIDGDLRSQMNAALAALTSQGFGQQELPLPGGGLMLANAQFAGLSTGDNFAVTGWALQLDARPDDKVPGLVYTRQARPLENLAAVPPQGDVQVFVPYTTIELGVYEAIQAGIVRSIPVPDPDGTGPLRAFELHLVPTSVPRVSSDPAAPQELLVECSARMEDTTVGTVGAPISGGGGPVPVKPGPSTAIDINAVDGSANLRLHLRFGANAASGIFANLYRLELLQVTGQLRYATASASISTFRTQIENAVNAALQARGGGRLPLLPRTLSLVEDLTVSLATPTPGQGYMRLPLTIVPRLQTIALPAITPLKP